MDSAQLKAARNAAGWTQQEAAARLGLSQPYYSQLENGSRPLSASLKVRAVRKLRLSPTMMPLPPPSESLTPVPPEKLAVMLARLGYLGFAHLRRTAIPVNPAELVAGAIVHDDLDPRLVEALPWLLTTFNDLDWQWLTAQCRLLNLQNRLGFLVSLARQLAKAGAAEHLRAAQGTLEASRLAAEGTLCRNAMPEAERNWIREHRSSTAAHWNLVTTLDADLLTHAA